jgi:glyoxylase-like metal-dependent hydrolase (beta-lactamase superfamily II)
MSSPPLANPLAPRTYGSPVKVTDRVYLWRNVVNSSIVIGDKGVAVLDTQVNLPLARRVVKTVRGITDKPILYAINTHYHWDHTNGNRIFREAGAELVARKMTNDFMVQRAPRQKAFLSGRGLPLGEDPVVAEHTFTGELELDLGGQPLRLTYLGAAESEDATAVHLPAEGVLIAGDTVMTGSFPIFGQPVWNEGLMEQYDWLGALDKVRAFKPAHVLPGHGPLAHDAEIDLLERICRYFLEEVTRRARAGMTLDRILADLEPKLPEWMVKLPVVWGCPRYAILRVFRGCIDDPEPGFQHFKPSAIPAGDPAVVAEKTRGVRELQKYLDAAAQVTEGGDVASGLELYREATRRFPADAGACVALADALMAAARTVSSVLEKGDFFVEAHNAVSAALEIDPNFGPAWLSRGQFQVMSAYRNGDDPGPGVKLVEKALECGLNRHGQAQAMLFLGMARRTEADEAGAKEFFRKALAIEPDYPQAAMALAAGATPAAGGV